MRSEVLLALSLAALSTGCGVGRPPDQDAGANVEDAGTLPLEVGTIEVDGGFIAMPPELNAHFGAQGGMHLNAMYRLPQGGSGTLTISHEVRRASDDKLVSRGTRQFVMDGGAVFTTKDPINVFICPTPVGLDVIGETLNFTVTGSSSQGTALGTAQTIFRCPVGNEMLCSQLCKG